MQRQGEGIQGLAADGGLSHVGRHEPTAARLLSLAAEPACRAGPGRRSAVGRDGWPGTALTLGGRYYPGDGPQPASRDDVEDSGDAQGAPDQVGLPAEQPPEHDLA